MSMIVVQADATVGRWTGSFSVHLLGFKVALVKVEAIRPSALTLIQMPSDLLPNSPYEAGLLARSSAGSRRRSKTSRRPVTGSKTVPWSQDPRASWTAAAGFNRRPLEPGS